MFEGVLTSLIGVVVRNCVTHLKETSVYVIPAKAGIQRFRITAWTPAFAGVTKKDELWASWYWALFSLSNNKKLKGVV